MKAIILAAGKSARLQPVTNGRPKCLLKIGQETIIDRQIEVLIKNGISSITIVTGYEADMLENHLKSKHPGLALTFVRMNDYATTKPAHGLWTAREYLKGPLIYLNADLLCEPSIIERVISFQDSGTAIQKIDWNEEAVNIIMDRNGITEIGKHIKKEDNHGEFLGATKLSPEFCEALVEVLEQFESKGEKNHFAVDAINEVIKRGKEHLYGIDVSDKLAIEIDTPEDYHGALKIWEEYESKLP